jgi:bacillithiol synthase
MQWIPYSEIESEGTGYSHLFLDYINNYSRVNNYFPSDFRNLKDWRSKLEEVTSRKLDRSKLTQILLNQNRDNQCGVKTLANIDLLLHDNTVAIVTGQQVGLFTGPLYTLFKTITTIKLAAQLSEQHKDFNFVPVFWLENEDHDFAEASSTSILNASNEILELKYHDPMRMPDKNYGAVGTVQIGDSMKDVFDALKAGLVSTEFTPKILELFERAYQKGMTFNRSFVFLLNELLEDSGLIFFNPHDAELKKMLAPVFKDEITNSPASCQLVISQSELLEQHYHAQVKPRPVNLFMFHQNGRYAIEPNTEGYFLKGTRKSFSKEELLALVQSDPSVFSPNVVLRPICQDFLLPTLAYVGGPSEIAYFAQFNSLYKHFNIPEPILYPRASATILEERVQKVLTKFHLKADEFFADIEKIKSRVADSISDFKVEELFTNTMGTVSESITSLKDGLEVIDPTLVPAMENTLSKMQQALTILKDKTINAQKRQHEISLRQLDKISTNLFPHSNLQEREINILYFINKYGLDFIGWLKRELVIDKFMHQIISMD